MSELSPIFNGQELSMDTKKWINIASTAAEKAGTIGFLKGGVLRDYVSNFYNGTALTSKDLDMMFLGRVNLITGLFIKEGAEIEARRNRKKTPVFVMNLPTNQGNISADIGIIHGKPYTYDRGHTTKDIIEDDAHLTDFTVNALFLPLGESLNMPNIIDPLNGFEDIRNRVIRMVAPNTFVRNCECMLRAVRFADKLGATIEPRTYDAIKHYSPLIKKAPQPVVDQNLAAILNSPNKEKNLALLDELQLLPFLHQPN